MYTDSEKLKIRDGLSLHLEIIEHGKPRWIIATHGVGEHLGRHKYLVELFKSNYNILFYDLRGHGQSEGKRAFVGKFEDYAKDLGEIIYHLKKNYKMEKYVLFGHSMGGLVTADFIQNFSDDECYPEKVFLSAPPIGLPGPGGMVMKYVSPKITEALAGVPFSLDLKGLVDVAGLSHDPRVAEDYKKDPLNCLSMHTKLALGLVSRSARVFSRPLRIKCPSFCAYGSNDPVCSAGATKTFFRDLEKNTQVFEVDGAFHELHNEVKEYKRPYMDFLVKSLSPEDIFA